MPALFALPPPEPGFEISLASRGMAEGISQTDGFQVIPRATLRIGGVHVGAQWRNIDSRSANGVAAFFLKYSWRVGKAQLEAGTAYRVRTGVRPSFDSKAWEFNASARRSFGKLGLRVGAEFSPRDFNSGRSLYVDAGPSFDAGRFKVSASIGRRERVGEPDYTSFSAGISRVVAHRLTLDARYYRTDRGELGDRYRGRVVFSARLAL